MSQSFSHVTVSPFIGGLTALRGVLDKAAAHAEENKIDPAALLEKRLFPDMFTFTRQIEAATDVARRTMDRLLEKELTTLGTPEATFEALGKRIDETIEHLRGLDAAELDAAETRELTAQFGPETKVDFIGRSYVAGFALPNFLFHVVTAYDIVRHGGVKLGKRDYLAPFVMVMSG